MGMLGIVSKPMRAFSEGIFGRNFDELFPVEKAAAEKWFQMGKYTPEEIRNAGVMHGIAPHDVTPQHITDYKSNPQTILKYKQIAEQNLKPVQQEIPAAQSVATAVEEGGGKVTPEVADAPAVEEGALGKHTMPIVAGTAGVAVGGTGGYLAGKSIEENNQLQQGQQLQQAQPSPVPGNVNDYFQNNDSRY